MLWEALEADTLVALVARANLSNGICRRAPNVVERGVAGHAEDPGAEAHLALLELADDPHQLGEQVVGDVLGGMALLSSPSGCPDPESATRVKRPVRDDGDVTGAYASGAESVMRAPTWGLAVAGMTRSTPGRA